MSKKNWTDLTISIWLMICMALFMPFMKAWLWATELATGYAMYDPIKEETTFAALVTTLCALAFYVILAYQPVAYMLEKLKEK